MSGELDLWNAVLCINIADALAADDPREEVCGASRLDRQNALKWIGTNRFRFVVSLAGHDPAAFEQRVRDALALPLEDRAHVLNLLSRGQLFASKSRHGPSPQRNFAIMQGKLNRERVAKLYQTGMSRRQIAASLGMTEGTVQNHLRQLRKAGHIDIKEAA